MAAATGDAQGLRQGMAIVATTAQSLFGRERDVAALEAFVAQAAGDGGAVLVTGEAGVGKTAVVDVVAAGARQRGVRVLRAAGTESEAALSFAGLNQLLHRVLNGLPGLEEADRRALRVALGLGEGRASDEFAVAQATVRLLAHLDRMGRRRSRPRLV
jgi:hypothetical protein